MARSHHRKKHKAHLQRFRHSQDIHDKPAVKGKLFRVFTILGALTGFAICYFATGAATWLVLGTLAGAAAGYFTGRAIDNTTGNR